MESKTEFIRQGFEITRHAATFSLQYARETGKAAIALVTNKHYRELLTRFYQNGLSPVVEGNVTLLYHVDNRLIRVADNNSCVFPVRVKGILGLDVAVEGNDFVFRTLGERNPQDSKEEFILMGYEAIAKLLSDRDREKGLAVLVVTEDYFTCALAGAWKGLEIGVKSNGLNHPFGYDAKSHLLCSTEMELYMAPSSKLHGIDPADLGGEYLMFSIITNSDEEQLRLEKQVSEVFPQDKRICNVCSKPCKNKCASCKCTYYCSGECQRKDWKRHKKLCHLLIRK